jgi:hypothetical protein
LIFKSGAKVRKSCLQTQRNNSFSYFRNPKTKPQIMRYIIKSISFSFILSFLSLNLFAQYGPQFDNRGFEQWTTRDEYSVSEPVHWHSGGTATGSFSGFLSSQIEQSTQLRPGSSGSKSVRIYPSSLLGITANGTVTNGRINAGSMSATGSGNYNYTQRAENAFNTPISQLPDSLTIWVCFRSQLLRIT